MEAIVLLAIIAMIIVAIGVFLAAGVAIGKFAFGQPVMTIEVWDAEPARHGKNPVLRYIQYHPTSGFWNEHSAMPTEHGTIEVVEKYGFNGWRRQSHFWKEKDVLFIGDKRKGKAIHMPDAVLGLHVEMMDRLKHKNSELALQVDKARTDLLRFQREQELTLEERDDNRVKTMAKLLPAGMMASKSRGSR